MQQEIIKSNNYAENIKNQQEQQSDEKFIEQQNIHRVNKLKQGDEQIHQNQHKMLSDENYQQQHVKIISQQISISMNPQAMNNSDGVKNAQALQNVIKHKNIGININSNSNNTNINNRKKIRLYIQDFEPYFPSFLQQINRYHLQNIPRIGPQYQIPLLEQQPRFESYYRPIDNLRVHKGSDKDFSQQAYKRFKQLLGRIKLKKSQFYQDISFKLMIGIS